LLNSLRSLTLRRYAYDARSERDTLAATIALILGDSLWLNHSATSNLRHPFRLRLSCRWRWWQFCSSVQFQVDPADGAATYASEKTNLSLRFTGREQSLNCFKLFRCDCHWLSETLTYNSTSIVLPVGTNFGDIGRRTRIFDAFPQHFLNFAPLPHQHSAFLCRERNVGGVLRSFLSIASWRITEASATQLGQINCLNSASRWPARSPQ
jgi:hypothetical protein